MKFLYVFDPNKPRPYLVTRGPLFVAIGFAFAVVNLLLVPIVGIPWGIDFAGGMEMQVRFAAPVDAERIRAVLEREGFAQHQVQQYGPDAAHEWLVRVERVATVTPAQLDEVSRAVQAAGGGAAKVALDPSGGDRFTVALSAPSASDALALEKALDAQQALVASAVQDAGLALRRTIAADGTESHAGAVVSDEPYAGKVTYLVLVQGVSDKIGKALADAIGAAEVRRVDFVDATVASQLKNDGFVALVVALALIVVYVAVRFDWTFAPGALIALLHDPVGALCVYTVGRADFDLPSVAAMLTIVGYSINNTIVIYDRIRETTPRGVISEEELRSAVAAAVSTTLNRTFNSTLTTLCTSVAVWIFTEGAVRTFAACLSVGITVGAYSSILMAPTIYLAVRRRFLRDAPPDEPAGPTREERERGIV